MYFKRRIKGYFGDFHSYSFLNSLEAINRRLLGFVNHLGEAWQLGKGREDIEFWADRKSAFSTGLFFPFAMSISIMFVSVLSMS